MVATCHNVEFSFWTRKARMGNVRQAGNNQDRKVCIMRLFLHSVSLNKTKKRVNLLSRRQVLVQDLLRARHFECIESKKAIS